MNTLCQNFSRYLDDPELKLLPVEDLKLLLKHKRLSVNSEDQVIQAVFNWAEHLDRGQDEISQILACINWNYVSHNCLLDLLRKAKAIRANPDFQEAVKREMVLRLKFCEDFEAKITEPRYSYKYIGASKESLR